MATAPFEHASDASAALREIVADHGVDGLSQPGFVARLLSDLLPDAPGVARVLTAAAEFRVAETLRDHEATGMDAATARRLTAASFATATMFTPEVCNWVVGEFAAAAGLPPGSADAQSSATILPAGVIDLGEDDAATSKRTLAASPSDPGGQHATQAPVTASPPDLASPQEPTRAPDPASAPPGSDQPGQADATARAAFVARPADLTAASPTARIGQPQTSQPAQTISQPPASPRATGRRFLWPVAGAAAVLAVIVGVVVWAPWSSSPPLRPNGLNTVQVTARSVTLGWAHPSSGPAPGSYLVLRNGSRVGSVSGSIPVDDITGLDPATSYRFQVVAVSGGQRSAPSRTLTVTTGNPPLTAAVLTGIWLVQQRITHSDNEPTVYSNRKLHSYTWDFESQCANASCPVSFEYHFDGYEIDGTLHHSGITYSGVVKTTQLLRCNKFPETSTVQVVIQVTQGGASDQNWTAVGWSGTVTVRDVTSGGGCGPSSWTAILSPTQS